MIAQMRADLACRGSQEWENPTLDRFLEALEAVLDGLPGRARPAAQCGTRAARLGAPRGHPGSRHRIQVSNCLRWPAGDAELHECRLA